MFSVNVIVFALVAALNSLKCLAWAFHILH